MAFLKLALLFLVFVVAVSAKVILPEPNSDENTGNSNPFTVELVDNRYGYLRRYAENENLLEFSKTRDPGSFILLSNGAMKLASSDKCLNVMSVTNTQVELASTCSEADVDKWRIDQNKWLVNEQTNKCLSPWNYQGRPPQDVDWVSGLDVCSQYNEVNINVTEVECKGTELDILYVVDGSGSITTTNFNTMKDFMKRLNEKFTIALDHTRIGLMQFSSLSSTRIEFGLDEKDTLQNVNAGIDAMAQQGGTTYTGDALRRAREEVFTGTGGDRLNVADILILLTDGQATDSDQIEQASRLKQDDVTVMTIAVGNVSPALLSDLEEMASTSATSDEKLTYVVDFNELDSIADALVDEACSSGNSS